MMIVAPSMEGHLEAQLDPVAWDGLQLVKGAAGYSETTARDHRYLRGENVERTDEIIPPKHSGLHDNMNCII